MYEYLYLLRHSNWGVCNFPILVPVVESLPSADEMSKIVVLNRASSVVVLSEVEKVGVPLLIPES